MIILKLLNGLQRGCLDGRVSHVLILEKVVMYETTRIRYEVYLRKGTDEIISLMKKKITIFIYLMIRIEFSFFWRPPCFGTESFSYDVYGRP